MGLDWILIMPSDCVVTEPLCKVCFVLFLVVWTEQEKSCFDCYYLKASSRLPKAFLWDLDQFRSWRAAVNLWEDSFRVHNANAYSLVCLSAFGEVTNEMIPHTTAVETWLPFSFRVKTTDLLSLLNGTTQMHLSFDALSSCIIQKMDQLKW